MESTEIEIPGLSAGFYASLAEAGITKCGTAPLPTGQKLGLLVDDEQRVVVVQGIKNRNTKGQPMTLTLTLFAGPPFDTSE